MLSCKNAIASSLVLRVVISALGEGGVLGGGEVGHITRISSMCYLFPHRN